MAIREFETTRGFRIGAAAVVLVLAVIAVVLVVDNQRRQAELTHVRIAGGGFLFYYRLGEIRAGITVVVQKPTPSQSRLLARFEDPAGGAPIEVETRLRHGEQRYGLETPPLAGVVKGKPYQVELLLYAYGGREPMEVQRTTLVSELDADASPDGPLTVGPGYHRPPKPETAPETGPAPMPETVPEPGPGGATLEKSQKAEPY